MNLRIGRNAFWISLVLVILGIFSVFVLATEVSATIPSILTLVRFSLCGFVSMILGLTVWSWAFPRLYVFRPSKSRRYDLVPIYYSLNGPRKSDAVVCRVREAGKENNRWDLRIVPLSAFSSEDRYSISILFNDITGAPMILEDSFLISTRKTYNRNLLTLANKETIVKEDEPKPAK